MQYEWHNGGAASNNSSQDALERLHLSLETLGRHFNFDSVLSEPQGEAQVLKYYLWNRSAYSLLYDRRGFMHMGISDDGQHTKRDVFAQVRFISEQINESRPARVLELGSGTGVNTVTLANKHSDVRFYAIDRRKRPFWHRGNPANVEFLIGDYHDLSQFAPGSVDLAFAIETLCYSYNHGQLMAEVFRVLRPGGVAITFEGFCRKVDKDLTSDERLGVQLASKAVGAERFCRPEDLIAAASSAGFELRDRQDLSMAVRPTAIRLEKRSRLFLSPPLWPIRAVLPLPWKRNVMCGLVLAALLESGAACYERHVFAKAAGSSSER